MSKRRIQKIKYDLLGNPFVTYKGTRLNLNLFQLTSNGEFFYCPCVFCAYKIEVDEYGENARVTFEKF